MSTKLSKDGNAISDEESVVSVYCKQVFDPGVKVSGMMPAPTCAKEIGVESQFLSAVISAA